MSASALWYAGLPDGVTDVLVGPQGGLFVAGFDSLKRRCLVLYAPPFGLPLRTVSTLPYRDFGRSAPTVLAARDPTRDRLYVLLYQQPDNLGLSQTSLYRVDPGSGERTLLAADSSPRWAPAAVLPRAGSVLVALRGLGPMLEYRACGEAACLAAMPVGSAASNASGKAGLAELAGRLLLVVGSDPIYATGGAVVCERRDGSLQPLLPPPPPGASPWGRPAGGRAGGERRAAHARARPAARPAAPRTAGAPLSTLVPRLRAQAPRARPSPTPTRSWSPPTARCTWSRDSSSTSTGTRTARSSCSSGRRVLARTGCPPARARRSSPPASPASSSRAPSSC
jgi:hypothetical protein